jgi:hypothetical protein
MGFLLTLVGALSSPALACSLCAGVGNRLPLRQEFPLSQLIVYGPLTNPRLVGNGKGDTDLVVETILRDDVARGGRKLLPVGRYVPVDEKNPIRYLTLWEVNQGRLELARSCAFKPESLVYLRGLLALRRDESPLPFCFGYLDHADPEVANDAFVEFARANDAAIGQFAKQADPVRLRKWLADEQTPSERLSLYAFLLGACGTERDADWLLLQIQQPSARLRPALSGLMTGYLQLRPTAGWDLAKRIFADKQRLVSERLAMLGAIRFMQAWQPTSSKAPILTVLPAALEQGDLADMVTEDLRRWGWWELTDAVLAVARTTPRLAPMTQRALLRYALTCPQPAAAQFLAAQRRANPELVREVEDGLGQ